MPLMQDFKAFILRGNVADMAVGVIIGGAFGKIVSSIVDDILMPPIGKLIGGVDFKDLFLPLDGGGYKTLADATKAGAPVIRYGVFLNQVLDFFIVAVVIFFVVNRLMALVQGRSKAAPEAPSTKECPQCAETILAKAKKCKFCASAV